MFFLSILTLFFIPFISSRTPKLTAYWVDDPINPKFPLESIPTWIDTVIIGFATVNMNSTVTFPYNQMMIQNGITYLQNNNQTVFLSVGGAANCGPKGISQDLMFSFPGFNSVVWANSVANLMNIYGLTNLDLDVECRNGVNQNSVNINNALSELKNISSNITISFVAFSRVAEPTNWQNYKDTFIIIRPYIDIVFWASYNFNLNPAVSNEYYSNANLTSITQFGYNLSSTFYGYCVGTGCVWGVGPSNNQILLWANNVKNYGGGGLFIWSLQDELSFYNKDFALFNTTSISKQVADILHS